MVGVCFLTYQLFAVLSMVFIFLHHIFRIFTVRHYASPVYTMTLCLSVCLFITSRSYIKTAKDVVTQTQDSSYFSDAKDLDQIPMESVTVTDSKILYS